MQESREGSTAQRNQPEGIVAPVGNAAPFPREKGKYAPGRYPQLEEYGIDPGENWPEGKPLPPGFKLDKSHRIWPTYTRAGRVAPDEKRCVGTNTDGSRCPMYQVRGRTTCRMHGAGQRVGIDHPRTKTGEQFRHGIFGDLSMPQGLSDWYQKALGDSAIYDLTHNIAILVGRERELLGGLSNGEARASWEKAAKLFDALNEAILANDAQGIRDAMKDLGVVLKNGRTDTQIWSELGTVGERKRRMMESERKRRLDLKMVVSADQLRAILRSFTIIVFSEIQNMPGLIKAMVRHDGALDTGKLSQALIAKIGRRMGDVSDGMKAGRLADTDV